MRKTLLPAVSLTLAISGAAVLQVGAAQAVGQPVRGSALQGDVRSLAAVAVPTAQRRPLTCHGFRATIVGTTGNDVLRGTKRRDVIVARAGADRVNGLGGNDVVCGGAGNDLVLGGRGADLLFGDDGADTIAALAADRAFGGAGGDTVSAAPGSRVLGGPGRDSVTAHPTARANLGAGDDLLVINRMTLGAGGRAKQVLLGGAGADIVTVFGNEEGDPMRVDLRTGRASGTGVSGRFAGFEGALGDLGNDVLIGNGGPNLLLGDFGEDRLVALGGDDVVDGQQDDDSLDGGAGTDQCSAEVEAPVGCESTLP